MDGVIGARMMGGGFGGCTINLMKKEAVQAFQSHILLNYKTPEGSAPLIIIASIEDGVKRVDLNGDVHARAPH